MVNTGARQRGSDTGAEPAEESAEEILIQAFKSGRPIVPFLGAGISINTGFPPIGEITSYLAKVRHYIDCVRPRADLNKPGGYATYLQEFGWPDLNELNANIWRYVTRREGAALKNLLDIADGLVGRPGDYQGQAFRYRWIERANFRPQQVVDMEHLRVLSEKDWEFARRVLIDLDRTGNPPWPGRELRQRGDWYELMMKLSEGNFDLVDSLFGTLARGRQPGHVHTLLSQLVSVLGVNLFLTLNFDPFLETALRAEGHQPRVVDTSREADLPSTLVVLDRLSVVKLHGTAYGLRIGEKIQVSLDSETRLRALDLIPTDALILVMGFSGGERRMLQLLGEVARRGRDGQKAVLWMHWLKEVDSPAKSLVRDNPGRVASARYRSVEGFLSQVLCTLRGGFPSTKASYRALPTRSLLMADEVEVDPFASTERIRPFFGVGLRNYLKSP